MRKGREEGERKERGGREERRVMRIEQAVDLDPHSISLLDLNPHFAQVRSQIICRKPMYCTAKVSYLVPH